ncbi:hypothetical protein BDW75DRAFT_247632 [Aspergillus navahoensis]
MSFDRIIQDSDDDEEPFEELPRQQTNRVPVIDDKMQHDADILQTHDVNHNSHIGVNFDAFLQSQGAPQTNLTASQQRREERWIPSTGRAGSSGNMMTEIGIAQQRLFDDDQQAQYAHQQTISHKPEQVQDDKYAMAASDDLSEAHKLSNVLAQDPSARSEPHGLDASDWSQTASYNIFDSSSYTPSSLVNTANFVRDLGSMTQTEAVQNFGLRRWTSMQGEISSPHDTEPFSSVISPKITRAKSDIAASNGVHPSSASVDELSLPVRTETPKAEKSGCRKRQAVLASDENDELSLPQLQEPRPIKLEKRKPGRPRKSTKVDVTVSTGSVDLTGPSDISSEENKGPAVPNTLRIPVDGITVNVAPPQRIIDDSMHDNQSEQSAVLAPKESPQIPAASTKEPKKKKLKRGKTTSVTLTKTYESDVEDDVIWVEQRPAAPTCEDNKTSNPIEPSNNTAAEQTLAPKKRGRKRKKTSEHLDQEATTPLATDEQNAQTTTPNKADNTPQPTDSHNESGISVVLKTNHTIGARASDLAEPITDEYQAPPELHQPTSPAKLSEHSQPVQQPPETPQKRTDPKTLSTKGPGKHSPISSTSKVPYRVGLSKKARIEPLLKIIKR